METKVRSIAREVINGLQNAQDTKSIVEWLSTAKWLVTNSDGPIANHELPGALSHHGDIPLVELKNLFIARHYGMMCNTVLDLLSVEWLQKLPGRLFAEYVEGLILSGPPADTLLSLDLALEKHK
jgi:hypothetical protein